MKNSKKNITIFSKEVIQNFKIILIAILISIITYATYYFTMIYPIYKNIESSKNRIVEMNIGFDKIENKVRKYYDSNKDIEYSSYQDLLNKRRGYSDYLFEMYKKKNKTKNNFDEYFQDVTFELSKKMKEWDLKTYKRAHLDSVDAKSLINRYELPDDLRQNIQMKEDDIRYEKRKQIEFAINSFIYSAILLILGRYLIMFVKLVIKNSKNEI